MTHLTRRLNGDECSDSTRAEKLWVRAIRDLERSKLIVSSTDKGCASQYNRQKLLLDMRTQNLELTGLIFRFFCFIKERGRANNPSSGSEYYNQGVNNSEINKDLKRIIEKMIDEVREALRRSQQFYKDEADNINNTISSSQEGDRIDATGKAMQKLFFVTWPEIISLAGRAISEAEDIISRG